ncbi:uncharacterized protein B0I36DRAFT_358161 [Microdochium trichocladiopsis]|uniref:BZIP domain-containing protein n=1 Tax=Microdochium trichocladiopsis TaxID=1682393 RepID=A0A9P9BW27_9PEZI|nr:uncharacterized protein B0I36DRAFT_358161 [Microdochium trichocladiopsis]KAH7040933.1 hypothetical protein B0I36DRAFT_358161 [Microdochium trichocladiopsis]
MPDGGHGSETRGSTSGATEPASDEISVRRERGKLAQRAFRQRQIDMIRILKDENAKLKDAISTISTAAYRSQRELKDAITEACRIAELNPSGAAHESSPAQQADDDFEHGSVTTQSPRPSSAQPLSSSYPPLGQGASAWPAPLELRSPHIDTSQPGLGSNSLYGFDPSHNQGYVNSHADLFAPPVAHMNAAPINGLRPAHAPSFSTVYSQGYAEIPPRGKSPDMMPFDQSIQPYLPSRSSPPRQEHATAILQAQAPEDIMPYLGPRAYTIAGQVYWATLGYAWQVLRTLDTSYPAHSPETLGTVYNLFHIDATNPQSTAVVKDHLYRRLAFRKQRAASVRPGEAPSQHHLANHGQQHQQHPPRACFEIDPWGAAAALPAPHLTG